MPTQIIQSESNGRTYLRVKGEMMLDDAVLLEKISAEMNESLKKGITIDLADLDFLDSESASILKRIQSANGIEIEGLEIFVQTAIDHAERASK